MQKPIIFSGIKPSGDFNIGGYLGSLKNWVELQDKYRSYYCIVDQHAITVPQEPANLYRRTLDLAKIYFACGISDKNSVIFIQSHVPQHSYLAWILNCFTQMGELEKMTQYKEKAGSKQQRASVGLFDYPVLMAADILLYQTELVPVGEDQIQHVELTRDIAKRFNNKYGEEIFKIPEYFIPKFGARIKGLQNPEKKMSKSDNNPNDTVFLLDTPDKIRKKIMKAVTDTENKILYNPKNKPGISNLLTIYSVITDKTIKDSEKYFKNKQYGQFKKELADNLVNYLSPVQKKYEKINDKDILKLLNKNALEAKKAAQETIKKVKEKIGFV